VLLSQPFKQNLSVYSHNAWIAESLKCYYTMGRWRTSYKFRWGGSENPGSTFVR